MEIATGSGSADAFVDHAEPEASEPSGAPREPPGIGGRRGGGGTITPASSGAHDRWEDGCVETALPTGSRTLADGKSKHCGERDDMDLVPSLNEPCRV